MADRPYRIEVVRMRRRFRPWRARVVGHDGLDLLDGPVFRGASEREARQAAQRWCDRDHKKRFPEVVYQYSHTPGQPPPPPAPPVSPQQEDDGR